MIPFEAIAGFGIFFGCFCRGIAPFLKKRSQAAKDGKDFKWDRKYGWTFGIAVFGAVVATMFLLPTFSVPKEYIFPTAFLVGWAAEDIVNKVVA